MKHLALAIALACGGALATSPLTASPAAAAATAGDESIEAVIVAAKAAEAARDDMRDTFDRISLKPGEFLWKKSHGDSAVDRVVIDLTEQMAYAYLGGDLVAVSTISSGREQHPSPVGIFAVLEKQRDYRSIKYEAPMPFMQRIDNYGIALHAGHLPGRPASHGCIRLPRGFAAKLFKATQVGTAVLMGKPAYLAELREAGHDV